MYTYIQLIQNKKTNTIITSPFSLSISHFAHRDKQNMYISGFKLDAAPTPAVQARQLRQDRQNAFWDSRNKNNDKLDKFPLILTNKMKQLASNNPNNRRLKKHSINNYVNNKNREYISMNKPGFNDGNINKKKMDLE